MYINTCLILIYSLVLLYYLDSKYDLSLGDYHPYLFERRAVNMKDATVSVISFHPSELEKEVCLRIINDFCKEGNETVHIDLLEPKGRNVELGGNSDFEVIITDGDDVPEVESSKWTLQKSYWSSSMCLFISRVFLGFSCS